MTGGLAYMPWFPRDFRSSTLTWPAIARLVYRELLDVQWDAGGLPDDSTLLRELARVSVKDWRTAWPFIEPKFPVNADGQRRNARLEQHRTDADRRRESARRHASTAANARWKNDARSNAQAMPEHGSADARSNARAYARGYASISNSKVRGKRKTAYDGEATPLNGRGEGKNRG